MIIKPFKGKKSKRCEPEFCSWMYWLLKAAINQNVQVCDARNDAQRIAVWLKIKLYL